MSSLSFISPEALTELFRAVNISLPKYVPAMPSIILGLSIMFSMLFIGLVIGGVDARKQRKSKSFVARSRWMLIVLASLVAGILVGNFAEDKHYTVRCIYTNRQHYANVHWLRLYSKAYRTQQ